VDFTTLELRYAGGLAKGKGIQYSMKADPMPNPDENPGFGGQAKMQLASDSLFTWLALTPERLSRGPREGTACLGPMEADRYRVAWRPEKDWVTPLMLSTGVSSLVG
jgi:hypothetical protein